MNSKAETGKAGEELAAHYLKKKGYRLLEKNYRYKHAEIDLIVSLDDLLVFVEVKTKSNTAFGHPEIAVNERKAAKVMEGAEHYIHQNNWKGNIRFDVISIIKIQDSFDIEHFEDAFY